MPDASTGTAPSSLAPLIAKPPNDRLEVLRREHPDYLTHASAWQVLLDGFEGTGGFLDGAYLWPYPREGPNEFAKRQKRARYHNYYETIVDLYVRFMFTSGVKRKSASTDYDQWLEDVDGAGTPINTFMKRAAAQALAAGHTGVLLDKTADAPEGPTKAEERARPVATIFPATAIADWRFTGPTLVAVKLYEAAPEPSILDPAHEDDEGRQYLIWETEGWGRFSFEGDLVGADSPNLGLVPFSVLRPKPSHLSPMLGRALVSNANILRALFNRHSEEDNVLRDQAFSMLTVSVPADGDVELTKEQLGAEVGSTRAIVAQGTIAYATPDQSVPETIRNNAAYLVQELYRAAHVRFRRDSLQTESGESIRLQFSELNEMLQGFSKELADLEQRMARHYFAWQTATPEQGEAAFQAANIEVAYPDEFFSDALIEELTAWAEALRMNLGVTASRRLKKRVARRLDPDAPPEVIDQIDAEIDQQDAQALSGVMPVPLDLGPQMHEQDDAVA